MRRLKVGHVYLHLLGLDATGALALSDRVAEGLCELVAYLWDASPYAEGDTADRTSRARAMETSRDAIYGDGLRDALAAYRVCGDSFSQLLQRVKESGGRLPRAGSAQAALWAREPARAWQGCAGAFHALGEERRADSRLRARLFDESRRQSLVAAN